MTYRNDPYDPKQVALLDPAALEGAAAAAEKAFAEAGDLDALAAVKHLHLGDRAPVSLARREIGALPATAKADAGRNVNKARQAIQGAFDARRAALEAERAARVLREETVDVTLPTGRRPRGSRHPLSRLNEQVEDLFIGMGYEIAEGPEVESSWYNFDALNMGPDHPARQMMDTFYLETASRRVSEDLVLRTHTSPVQIRSMLNRDVPLYLVCPGRVYRTDELDATHTPVFTQVEGLVVDKNVTMAQMRGTLEHFAREMIGADITTRLRPSYFPFTEPSAELDLWWPAHRDGPRWIEWGGCGMVNPRVLRACGVDPDVYTGFAFGMGIERTLMLRRGVTDMRHMVEGDVRFARAYGREV